MNADTLLPFIQHFGYAALFFALWLGIVGMPVPDEVVVMTGGALTANGFLHVAPAFALTYLGVVSGLSLGYALGRLFGNAAFDRLRRRKNINKYIDASEKLVQKYGRFALCISYFFPIVRHVMPYIVGLHQMAFRQYALFSFTTGLVWTGIFFAAGRLVGDHAQTIGELAYRYGSRLIWVLLAVGAAVLAIRYMLKQYKSKGDRLH